MPIFQCSKCGCVENTALSGYWRQVHKGKKSPLCSECDSGKWHGAFKKVDAHAVGYMLGADNFLYGPQEKPRHTTIIGLVPPIVPTDGA